MLPAEKMNLTHRGRKTAMLRCYLLFVPILLFGVALSADDLAGQAAGAWNVSSTRMNRAELQALLQDLETATGSAVYGRGVSESANREARLVRERLELGDFRVGDRIELRVTGEAGIPETVIVEPGPAITLPELGTVSLAGVLRSELEEHLTRQFARVILNPEVRARALVRIGVIGSVTNAGFYPVPAEALLDEAIMIAGGLTSTANLETARVVRGGQIVIDQFAVTQALAAGRTIDQLNMAAGDQIVIDERPVRGDSFLRAVLITVVTVGLTVLIGSR